VNATPKRSGFWEVVEEVYVVCYGVKKGLELPMEGGLCRTGDSHFEDWKEGPGGLDIWRWNNASACFWPDQGFICARGRRTPSFWLVGACE